MQLNISFLPAILLSLSLASTGFTAPEAKESDLGLWVWRRHQVTEPTEREALIEFSKKWQIKRLLVQIRFEGEGKDRVVADQDEWRQFLKATHAAGIAVEALDGEAHMGLASQRQDTLERLAAVIAFQKSLPEGEKLAGVHYDIEPYLTQRWRDGEMTAVAQENIETYAAIRELVTPDTGLLLSFDIPAFYDRHAEALTFEFRGEKKNFHQHIQDLADYIGVMSYRRHATGQNSILDISSAEIAYGEKIGRKVYPAIETGELKAEPSITFYGMPGAQFREVLTEVQTEGGKSPAFGGVLLHHYEGVKALLEREEQK